MADVREDYLLTAMGMGDLHRHLSFVQQRHAEAHS